MFYITNHKKANRQKIPLQKMKKKNSTKKSCHIVVCDIINPVHVCTGTCLLTVAK